MPLGPLKHLRQEQLNPRPTACTLVGNAQGDGATKAIPNRRSSKESRLFTNKVDHRAEPIDNRPLDCFAEKRLLSAAHRFTVLFSVVFTLGARLTLTTDNSS